MSYFNCAAVLKVCPHTVQITYSLSLPSWTFWIWSMYDWSSVNCSSHIWHLYNLWVCSLCVFLSASVVNAVLHNRQMNPPGGSCRFSCLVNPVMYLNVWLQIYEEIVFLHCDFKFKYFVKKLTKYWSTCICFVFFCLLLITLLKSVKNK